MVSADKDFLSVAELSLTAGDALAINVLDTSLSLASSEAVGTTGRCLLDRQGSKDIAAVGISVEGTTTDGCGRPASGVPSARRRCSSSV